MFPFSMNRAAPKRNTVSRRALRSVAVFIVMIFLVHLFFTEGQRLLSLAPLPVRITQEDLLRENYVTWQFAGLILAAAVLTRSTSPSELDGGIERLLRPLSSVGIPSQDLAVMIAMALCFMPILLEDSSGFARLACGFFTKSS